MRRRKGSSESIGRSGPKTLAEGRMSERPTMMSVLWRRPALS
jgi:hypothetical protein